MCILLLHSHCTTLHSGAAYICCELSSLKCICEFVFFFVQRLLFAHEFEFCFLAHPKALTRTVIFFLCLTQLLCQPQLKYLDVFILYHKLSNNLTHSTFQNLKSH